MTRIAFAFFALLPFATRTQTISDCLGAIPLCDDFYSEDEAPLNTGDFYEWTGVCNLNVESNSVWYTFTVQDDGTISFIIDPVDDMNDYDWALFDITEGGCEGIVDGGSSPEVSCNSYGVFGVNGPTGISTAEGGTGNSNGPGDLNGPPFNADLPVTAGSTFALVVMNWSLSLDGYSIDFGGSTASLYDDEPPSIVSVTSDCANQILTVQFSEPIIVSTVQNEDFQITGPDPDISVVNFIPSQGAGAEMDNTFDLYLDEQVVQSGSYTITITFDSQQVEDVCGNLGEGSFTFDLVTPMTVDVETTTACNGTGGSIEIVSINGGEAPFDFFLNGVIQGDLFAEGLADGNYIVSISDNGVCDLTQTVEVPNNEINVGFNGVADTLSCLDPLVEIDFAFVNPEQTVNWIWTTADGHIFSGGSSLAVTVDEPGTYTATATNAETGCFDSASIEVMTDEEVQFDFSMLLFPNIITPNNDHNNNEWRPFLANDPEYDVTQLFKNYELRVFNRWGGLVFESGPNQKAWLPEDQERGMFYYTLKYETLCGEGAKGDVEGYIQVTSID